MTWVIETADLGWLLIPRPGMLDTKPNPTRVSFGERLLKIEDRLAALEQKAIPESARN